MSDMALSDDARIHDRGYRTYDGRRTGLQGAMRAVVVHSWQRTLGLKRSAWMKVLPIGVVILAYLPGAAFVGVAALLPEEFAPVGEELIPEYAAYYGFITAAIFLFASFVAPELLCTDRRSGQLGLYLASPLTRGSYLAAKAVAVFTLLSLVTFFPPFLLLIGYSLVGAGPAGVGEFLVLVLKILASGVVMSLGYTMVSLAVSATTDRKAAASAVTLGLLVGSGIVTSILVEAGFSPLLRVFNILGLPLELTFRIHGEAGGDWPPSEISTAALALGLAAWVAVCAAWIWDRYRRVVVRR